MSILKQTILIIFLIAVAGCREEESNIVTNLEVEAPVLSIPGTILLPDTSGFFEMEDSNYDAVLLFCWLPIGGYTESESDLQFLSTVGERGITPIPVQFNTAVRNASQTQLNTLGISISVALGDDELKDFLVTDNLPVAVLLRSDGTVARASGFGCTERTLRGAQ